jgi:hypothetical protein
MNSSSWGSSWATPAPAAPPAPARPAAAGAGVQKPADANDDLPAWMLGTF